MKDKIEYLPDENIKQKIFRKVKRDLNPSGMEVFTKLSITHFFVAILTLTVCPQFRFRLIGEGEGLLNVFMNFGEHGCMMACGSFFIGTSIFVAGLIFSNAELRVLRSEKWIFVAMIVFLSLGFFLMLKPSIVFYFSTFWAIGSLFTGVSLIETFWFIRKNEVK